MILNATDSLVVMLMAFRRGSARVFDYFVYRAGLGKPSLDLIPGPSCPEIGLLLKQEVGVVPCGAGGEHYALAFLVLQLKPRVAYDVHVFSSETRAWSVKAAKVAADPETTCRYHDVVMHSPSKAVAAGGGSLAWIDLWRGILQCNVLDEDPVLRLIPWPVPSPRDEILGMCSAHSIRDATLSNGVVRFVDLKFDDDDGASVYPYSSGDATCTGWTATVWERSISSKDWNRRFKADIASILATDSSHSDSLREVWDDEAKKRGLSKVSSAPPTLSLGDEEVVYFMANLVSNEALVLAVNAREERLEAVGQTALGLACSTCNFPRFLDSSQHSPIERADSIAPVL
ncbi:hypothetical protein SEVIR_9G451401v4 [Setaria viridis]|nr:uncharacterized protein LOC111258481 [Setaria italica]